MICQLNPLLLLFSFLLCAFSGFSQSEADGKLRQKIGELKTSGVKLQVYYHVNCIGSMRVIMEGDTICHPYEVGYLIWEKGNESFIQRFDECKIYQPHVIGMG